MNMEQKEEGPEPEEKTLNESPVEQKAGAEQSGAAYKSPPSKEIDKDARMWAMFCHLAGLCALLPIIPVIGGVVGPLIIWQVKKDTNPFIDEQGKEAVNFQISILMYFLISIFLCIVCVGAFLVAATIFIFFVFLLIAAVKANNGYHYRYPLTIRFIK
jgi:uncharacterized Tic20 family protein